MSLFSLLGAQNSLASKSSTRENAFTFMFAEWKLKPFIDRGHREISKANATGVHRRFQGAFLFRLPQRSQLRADAGGDDVQRLHFCLRRDGSFRWILPLRAPQHEDEHGEPAGDSNQNNLLNALRRFRWVSNPLASFCLALYRLEIFLLKFISFPQGLHVAIILVLAQATFAITISKISFGFCSFMINESHSVCGSGYLIKMKISRLFFVCYVSYLLCSTFNWNTDFCYRIWKSLFFYS